MAAKKLKYTRKNKEENNNNNNQRESTFSSSPHIFQTLISQIRSQQGLKLPILKSLYYLLNRLSLNETTNLSDEEINVCGFVVKFDEICSLSNVLFEECDNRFNRLFYAYEQGHGFPGLYLSVYIDKLTLLLRCCMVILTLSWSVYDQNVLIQNGQVLLSILSRLTSVEVSWGNEKMETSVGFPKLVPWEYTHLCLPGSSNPFQSVVSALLEVFTDELLMHKSLQECFLLIDSASSTSKMLFRCHFAYGDIGTVLEVIAAHFIRSFSNEQPFEGFLNRLVWQHENDYRIPDMSLTASLSLLQNPIMLSAPKMFQAYLILLVAEAIGIGTCSKHLKPDITITDYLTAFERSIILYTRHMSSLDMIGDPIGSNSSTVKSCMLGSSQLTYESYLQPVTRNMINHVVSKLNVYWDSYVNNRSKFDLLDTSIAYVRESLYLFDKTFEDEILSVLTSIVIRGASGDMCDTVLWNGGRNPEEILLLAAILKLMSSSMLQAIWCLRRGSSSGCLKTLQDVLLRKEYDFIVHLVGGFRQYNFHLPIQKFVTEMMKAHPTRHKESKWMLLHFSGLLSSSYVSRLDFLVKDCIFTMMSLLNFFVFEEGDLDALSLPFNSGLGSVSSKSSDKIRKALRVQRTSNKIASKFHNIQKLYLGKRYRSSLHKRNKDNQTRTSENASPLNDMESSISIEEDPGEVCNGEIFLKCIQNGSQSSSDIDDLADFIECKPGKDYSAWLDNRKFFRIWKSGRKAVTWCDKWKRKCKYSRKWK